MKAKKSIQRNRGLNFITKLQSLYLLCILPKLFDFKICSSSICYDTLTSKPSANPQKCSLHSPRPCAGICGGHALTCTPEQSSGWSRTSNSRYTAKSVAICCVLLPFLPKVVCLQSPLLYLLSSFFLLPHCVHSSGAAICGATASRMGEVKLSQLQSQLPVPNCLIYSMSLISIY